MKNWLPLLLGSLARAIATVPRGKAPFGGAFSMPNPYPGPPLPVPVGSPHCSTKRPAVVSRWHGVSSKKCFWARKTNDETVCGAALPLSDKTISPQLVVIVAVQVASSASVFGGGLSYVCVWPGVSGAAEQSRPVLTGDVDWSAVVGVDVEPAAVLSLPPPFSSTAIATTAPMQTRTTRETMSAVARGAGSFPSCGLRGRLVFDMGTP
jgi:hypothetical protein